MPGQLVLFNKPFGVLTQFTDRTAEAAKRETLADYLQLPGVYPAGRLDRDSEGLLLLTDNGKLQARISHPRYKLPKTYFAQVEGQISEQALQSLRHGITLKDGRAIALDARESAAPDWLWPRHPPIRYRASVADSWLTLTIAEGRNRQVRRMTAAVGFPTLRLIRYAIGSWHISDLQPGEFQSLPIGQASKELQTYLQN